MTGAQDKEAFLDRWSRRKRENKSQDDSKQNREKEKAEAPLPALPPIEGLTPESDFTGFMHAKVEDALRRVALKKLFSDPHFNIPDPFEAYSGDWTIGEPISDEMLATLNQARTLLFDDNEKKEEEKTHLAEQAPAGEEPKNDESRRQDT